MVDGMEGLVRLLPDDWHSLAIVDGGACFQLCLVPLRSLLLIEQRRVVGVGFERNELLLVLLCPVLFFLLIRLPGLVLSLWRSILECTFSSGNWLSWIYIQERESPRPPLEGDWDRWFGWILLLLIWAFTSVVGSLITASDAVRVSLKRTNACLLRTTCLQASFSPDSYDLMRRRGASPARRGGERVDEMLSAVKGSARKQNSHTNKQSQSGGKLD